jgi:O-antigen/teichoic acid export membrane protein
VQGKIAKQSFWASIINYSGSAIGLFTTFYLFPLVYTEEQNGLIRFFIEQGALLAGVAQLGTGYSIWKFFPQFKNADKKHNGAGFWLLAIPFAGFLIVAAALLLFQGDILAYLSPKSPQFSAYFPLLIPFIFFFVYNNVFEIFSASLGNILYSSFLRENVVRIALGIIGFLFYLQVIDFNAAVKFTPAVYAFTAALNLYFILRTTQIGFKPDFIFVKNQSGLTQSFSRYSGYLFLTSVANLIVQRLDFLMVTAMKGFASTGIYSIAVNMAVLIEIPTRSILQISNPVLAEAMHRHDHKEMKRLYEKTTLNQFLIGALVLLIIWINIDVFYLLMPNGEKYAPGKYAVLLLGIGKLFLLLQGNSSAILTFSKKYYLSLIVNLASVAAGIALNNALIPVWGLEGAAAATAMTWLAGAVVTGFIIYSMYRMNPYTAKVIYSAGFIALLFVLNAFLKIPNHLIISAALKSILLPAIALWVIYRFRLSEDIRSILNKALAFIPKRG